MSLWKQKVVALGLATILAEDCVVQSEVMSIFLPHTGGMLAFLEGCFAGANRVPPTFHLADHTSTGVAH